MPSPPTTEGGKPRGERIMLVGDSDTGKSRHYLKVAEWHQRRKADIHFYGICTPGNEWDVLLAEGAEFEGLTNVTWDVVWEMQDWFDLYAKFRKAANQGDFLCCDVQGDLWTDAQTEYERTEHGGDLSTRWITSSVHPMITDTKEKKNPWTRINSRYNEFANNKLLRWPGHLVSLYWQTGIPDDLTDKDKEAASLFGPFELMPLGNKKDYKRFHTILHLARNSQGEYVWRTIRDRQRKHLGTRVERKKFVTIKPEVCTGKDLFKDYLMPVGGWKL